MKKSIFLILILCLSFFLRFYKLGEIPHGLYIDEVSIGYNAYSILKTGKDEHGEFLPFYFKSFGEYKSPVTIYLTAASFLIFGKNEFSVRFPSAFFGSLTVLILYLSVKELRKLSQKNLSKLGLLSSLILAISPWQLHFSRGQFEANIALFLFLSGTWLFFLFLRIKNNLTLFISLITYFLSTYTYGSFKLITPLVLFVLFVFLLSKKLLTKKVAVVILLIFFINLPFLTTSYNPKGAVRFAQTSVFTKLDKLPIYNKVLSIPIIYVNNYLNYFSLEFLFNKGDGINRHQPQNFGLLPLWILPFLIAGFLNLAAKRTFLDKVIFTALIISPIPAALTIPSPHALRSILFVIPLSVICAKGISLIISKKIFLTITVMIFVYQFAYYLHNYYFHYAVNNSVDWGGGMKETVEKTKTYIDKYKYILVRSDLKFNYIYFLFYAPDFNPIYINTDWSKPENLRGEKMLLVTPYVDPRSNKPSDKLIDKITLININKDEFANFWEI